MLYTAPTPKALLRSEPILVTGAAGHLGGAIARQLLARGSKVRALVRETSDLRGLPPGVEVVRGDVRRHTDVVTAMSGCAIVFHAAAIYSTDPSRANEIVSTAMEGTSNVVRAASENGIERLVCTSSVAAVGHNYDPTIALDEASWNSLPMDAYCSAKTDAERLAWALATELDVDMVVTNPGMVIGPGDFRPTPSNWFLLQYLRKPMPPYIDGGHSIVDIEDVARGHLLAATRGKRGERYILAGENVAVRDILATLARFCGARAPWIRLGPIALAAAGTALQLTAVATRSRPISSARKLLKLHRYYSYFFSRKAHADIGFTTRSSQEALARATAWFALQPGLLPTARRNAIQKGLERAAPDSLTPIADWLPMPSPGVGRR